ncbi:MAG: M20/M25/M40 family metallo-hydrolase [Paramuribaculum sp.]|nr:M20/M25/M40 family metallo-hydrolase [Paramuribaculum sp.]MDE7452388.1 M20/M25/M40 family metallo-hydrolase [Paramuribaculum sp.]
MKKILITIAIGAIFTSLHAEKPIDKGYSTINAETAEAHIGFLAADDLEGREAGYQSGRIAGNYLIANVKSMGLKPWKEAGYEQSFEAYRTERQRKGRYQVHPDSIDRLQNTVHQKLNLRNVLAVIPGEKSDEYVVMGAHYDHLGVDPLLDGDKIYNGADDNASGVSAVLQIARAFLESGQKPERTVIFAFWDGEEKGLLGSEYFMLNWDDPDKIKGYINFDMIGRNNREDVPEHVVYFYTAAYPNFEKWLRNDIKERGLNLKPDYRAWDRPIGGGDNGSFAKRDIPIIWYHTDGHPDYHQPSDHADKINYPKIVDITRAAYLNLWNLANPSYVR